MAETLDTWMFVAFRLAGGIAAVSIAFYIALALVMLALERVLCIAAMVEAVREAQRQGRAPITQAWVRFGRWRG